MDPLTIISLIESATQIAESLAPEVAALKAKGLITDEQQAQLMAAYKSLELVAAGQFAGPEWAPSTAAPASTPPPAPAS
jgi:hypothetical protein